MERYNYSLGVGWIMMVLSLVLNAVYYKLHPMRLPLSPKGKLQTHICGVLTCTCYAEPEDDFYGKLGILKIFTPLYLPVLVYNSSCQARVEQKCFYTY